ncbi:MAG: ACP S-malonyltransferase [Treponema sp.]|jgi:[acyl-carrier-protein] S-malonyltransferase|nr:ACP S-malonyltransferase [Treponema sp.]
MTYQHIVFLFPGQGAQYQGMGIDLLAASPAVGALFALASDIVGRDMRTLLAEADEMTLKRTDISQPTITLVNLAASTVLAERGVTPAATAGFSLGEYAALATAGVISAEDCFRLVKTRGETMQAASDALMLGQNPPGMAAVIGLAPERVETLIAEWQIKDLFIANINSPKQVAVSGTAEALALAESRFKEAGARRVLRLAVAGPFHSPLMAHAAEQFQPSLEAVVFNDPSLPLYSNVSGTRVSSGAEAKALALRQISQPVRWTDEEAAIGTAGVDAAVEAGPGKVLQGLWRDAGVNAPCFGVGTLADINKFQSEHS